MKLPRREIAVLLILVGVVAGALAVAAAWPKTYWLPSASMEPSFAADSRVPFARGNYADKAQIRRGDVVVFSDNSKGQTEPQSRVGRIIALENDAIAVNATGRVRLNGALLPLKKGVTRGDSMHYQEQIGAAKYQIALAVSEASKAAPLNPHAPPFGPFKVPQNQVFILADNRDRSLDSRIRGPVDWRKIEGRLLP